MLDLKNNTLLAAIIYHPHFHPLTASIPKLSALATMNKHASSSRSQPDAPNNAISTSKGSSSVSAERELDAWVKASAKELLKAIGNWKRAGKDSDVCPGTVTRYDAVEGTENDLRHNLVSREFDRGKGTALTVSQGPHLQETWSLIHVL